MDQFRRAPAGFDRSVDVAFLSGAVTKTGHGLYGKKIVIVYETELIKEAMFFADVRAMAFSLDLSYKTGVAPMEQSEAFHVAWYPIAALEETIGF